MRMACICAGVAGRWALVLACLLLALPVWALALQWLQMNATSWAVWRHLSATVLPGYAWQSLWLAVGVALGTALVGTGAAVLVTLCRFPARRLLQWALLLPLALPAYVLAYAYTDALAFGSPLQAALRSHLGTVGPLWPDVRNPWAATALFVLCLYPYVYLLVHAALGERATTLMHAAQLLGASWPERVWRVALPLARPAVVAGVALALMETLADYGMGAYFGLATFTTGIYRAWLSMNDAVAAAQLASVLLALVALLLLVERRAQARQRFASHHSAAAADAGLTLRGWRAVLATLACALPVLLGFVVPVGWMAYLVWREHAHGEFGLPWAAFGGWAWNSFMLAALAAMLATALALLLAWGMRLSQPNRVADRALTLGARALGLGYAVPGAVVAIGIMLPLLALQRLSPALPAAALFTGSVAGLLAAYLLRFSAVALQTVEAGYTRISPALDDTARMLGASPWRLLRRVHAPLLRRSAWVAMLLVFVDTLKELPATLALRPFGSDTLAVVAYNLARDERLAEAALPSLAIALVGVLPVLLLARELRAPVR